MAGPPRQPLRLTFALLSQIAQVGTTGTYTISILAGRGYSGTCPNFLGAPACGNTQPLLQTLAAGQTGYQQWAFTAVAATC